MKTMKLKLAAGIAAVLSLSGQLNAQNTSYNANTIPIGGLGSSAFGSGALNSNNGIGNVGIGFQSLFSNTTGNYNAALGYQSLYGNNADNNTALGFRAMKNNSSGTNNTASGFAALYTNSTGSNNVANGYQALYQNLSGGNNTVAGYNALYSNTTGYDNVANGHTSLYSNTSGGYNVANGAQALYSNTTGSYNIAEGWEALYLNVSGNYNAAFGYQTLYGNTADNNTGLGFRAMKNNTTGTNNAASGFAALYNNATGNNNSAHGFQALVTNIFGSNNTGLGYNADVSSNSLSNATVIGAGAIVNASNKVRIGNTTVTVIEGQVPFSVSDRRFKDNITEDVKGLEFIKLLRPVVYNFNTRRLETFLTKNMSPELQKAHLDAMDFAPSTAIRQSGFIAQEVEQAAKKAGYDFNGLHVPENDNDNYSLAYAEFVVPLVKGMQEQQKLIDDQKNMIDDQKKMIEALQQQLNDLQKNLSSTSTTGIEQTFMEGASMDQNVPNPFSRETVVKFNLPRQVNSASMAVYDLSGKQLKTLPINERGASSIKITSDDFAAGMYIYTIIADGKPLSAKRMVVAEK